MAIDPITELYYSGAWNDISADVRVNPGITINRGRRDWAGHADPSTANLALNLGASNVAVGVSGRYSPRNPRSDLHGLIGRNTPLRTRIGTRQQGLTLSGAEADFVSTPDTSSLDITGDIDVRIDIQTAQWPSQDPVGLARKYGTTGNQRSWAWWITDGGIIHFRWSSNGTSTAGFLFEAVSTVPAVPGVDGRLALRFTLDVDNGASGFTCTFYTAPTLAGTWTQLGSTLIGSPVTSIFASTAVVEVGRTTAANLAGFTTAPFRGRVFGMEIRQGITGTVRANPAFDTREPEATSWADSAGRTWTLQGRAAITDPSIRSCGEISSWPPKWDTSGRNRWVPVTASGVLRRIQQGKSPVTSAPRRYITSVSPPPVAYWPLDAGSGSANRKPLIGRHAIRPRDHDTTFDSADMAYWLDPGMVLQPAPNASDGTSGFYADVSMPVTTNHWACDWIMTTPKPTGSNIVGPSIIGNRPLTAAGDTAAWVAVFNPNDKTLDLDLRLYDDDGSAGGAELWGGTYPSVFDGKVHHFRYEIEESGTSCLWSFYADGVLVANGTQTSMGGNQGVGSFRVQNGTGLDPADTTPVILGHMVVWGDAGIPPIDEAYAAAIGHAGETAGARLTRLCGEAGIPLRATGDFTATEVMGPQSRKTLGDLLRECAEADLGLLAEPTDSLGLTYRTRRSMYEVSDTVVPVILSYEDEDVSPPFEPIADDQATRNDWTVSREEGDSAQVVQETGPLSAADPPDGVGRYDSSATLNVATDEQLDDQASWRVRLGTVDEDRFPAIHINLTTVDADLAGALLRLEFGDRLQVTDLPDWLPPEDLDQIVQGASETLGSVMHELQLNATPAAPWRVGVRDDGVRGRRDSAGSTLTSGVTSSSTSFSVSTPTGPKWSTAAGDLPLDFMIGGERIQVTAISGTGTPQTFTVTRGVNGISKAHASGAALALVRAAVRAL